jgi:tungstate transport system substrate-binding protein
MTHGRLATILLLAALALAGCGSSGSSGSASSKGSKGSIILATTTSTQDSGLLDVLLPALEKQSGLQVKTVAVGSGQALEMARRGEADVVLVHSPDAEMQFMKSGVADRRRLVMHNDFVIVGPAADPAHIRGSKTLAAFKRIALARAPFISRGDDSGTNALELELWDQAGIKPHGSWYQESGQSMGATLAIAAEKHAYTLSDRATYLTNKQARWLSILVQNDEPLLNIYHVIDLNRKAGARVNVAGGRAFADWIVSPEAQRLIGRFGVAKYHRQLFVPDAGKTEAEVRKAA